MREVMNYLDMHLIRESEVSCTIKPNGHYNVQGNWSYPPCWHDEFDFDKFSNLSESERLTYKSSDHASITINNETIIVGNMSVDGIWSKYHYLQTYEHIPRGEADVNGYYQRSTESEIIKYLKYYIEKLKKQ